MALVGVDEAVVKTNRSRRGGPGGPPMGGDGVDGLQNSQENFRFRSEIIITKIHKHPPVCRQNNESNQRRRFRIHQ